MTSKTAFAALLLLAFNFSASANEAMFAVPFGELKKETDRASKKKAEIARNLALLEKLSKKKILLEKEISSMLEEIAKAPDFNAEVTSLKASGVQSDVARSEAMQHGYGNINEELEQTWTTKK